MNILVIGAGNIGRRHIQSVYELRDKANIYVVEPHEEQLMAVKNEFEEIKGFNTIQGIPDVIDVAIIATSSNVRRTVFEELVGHSKVNNIIFEKVLFQKKEDYFAVEEILENSGIKAWVNCARREWDAYRWLKDELKDTESYVINYTGSEWGLGCNAIHFIDIIQYLTEADVTIDASYLEKGLYHSKRKNYYEMYGTIIGQSGRCRFYSLSCIKGMAPTSYEIIGENIRICINENEGWAEVSKVSDAWECKKYSFLQVYQSQLSAKVVESIMTTGTCNLTQYRESMKTHLLFLDALLPYFEKEGVEKGLCPIT